MLNKPHRNYLRGNTTEGIMVAFDVAMLLSVVLLLLKTLAGLDISWLAIVLPTAIFFVPFVVVWFFRILGLLLGAVSVSILFLLAILEPLAQRFSILDID